MTKSQLDHPEWRGGHPIGMTRDTFFRQLWDQATAAFIAEPGFINAHDPVSNTLASSGSSVSAVIDPLIGPASNFSAAIESYINFNANKNLTASSEGFTAAAIFTAASTTGIPGLVHTRENQNTQARGMDLLLVSGALSMNKDGIANVQGNLTVSVNTPYFAIGSGQLASGSNNNFLLMDLSTGVIRTQSVTDGSTITGSNNRFVQIGRYSINANWPGAISMAYASSHYLEMEEMLAWARDPYGLFRVEDRFALENRPIGAAPPAGPFGPLVYRGGELQSLTGGVLAA